MNESEEHYIKWNKVVGKTNIPRSNLCEESDMAKIIEETGMVGNRIGLREMRKCWILGGGGCKFWRSYMQHRDYS